MGSRPRILSPEFSPLFAAGELTRPKTPGPLASRPAAQL